MKPFVATFFQLLGSYWADIFCCKLLWTIVFQLDKYFVSSEYCEINYQWFHQHQQVQAAHWVIHPYLLCGALFHLDVHSAVGLNGWKQRCLMKSSLVERKQEPGDLWEKLMLKFGSWNLRFLIQWKPNYLRHIWTSDIVLHQLTTLDNYIWCDHSGFITLNQLIKVWCWSQLKGIVHKWWTHLRLTLTLWK